LWSAGGLHHITYTLLTGSHELIVEDRSWKHQELGAKAQGGRFFGRPQRGFALSKIAEGACNFRCSVRGSSLRRKAAALHYFQEGVGAKGKGPKFVRRPGFSRAEEMVPLSSEDQKNWVPLEELNYRGKKGTHAGVIQEEPEITWIKKAKLRKGCSSSR